MVPAKIIGTERDAPVVVLVVEDDFIVRVDVCDNLRSAGFVVIEVGTAHEALVVLRARSDVAVVVTDIRMPGAMDGSGLIRQIRRHFPAVKVIAATAYENSEPVDATIKKPYPVKKLITVIRSLLDE
jgi:two-component system, response regulator PdtaR